MVLKNSEIDQLVKKNRAMLRIELVLEYLPPSFKLVEYYLSLLQKEIFLPKVKNLLHQN